ncbi:MAG TPA: hypothetical protein VKY74_12050, partial [Chloroflexia bacterium]|nr:hypothetical protein [Chloroflexia bacterium]
YGVYLAELLTRTLPQILAAGPAGPGTAAPAPSTVHWRGPLDLLGWTFDYLVSPLPLLLGLAGLAAFWLRGRPPGPPAAARRERLLATLMAAWLLILPIFLLVNYRVDMIGKHLFYTMVPLALGSGLFLWRLTRRGGWGQVWAWLLAGTLATTALVFWIARLVQASS